MSTLTSPRVTVITATYNRPDCLKLTLESLLAQTYTDFEAWVIGDACTDQTSEVVSSFGDERLHYHNREQNSGSQAAPNNDGFARARGELIAYLGHDDLWLPGHLEALVGALDETGAALAYTLSARIGPDGVVGCLGPADPQGELRIELTCPPSSWLVRRSAIEELHGWGDPARLDYAVDRDVLMRLTALGRPLHCHPRLTVLKFPSSLFPAAYRGGAATQERYAEAMRADAAGLERRLLNEIAYLHARHRCPTLGWPELVRRAGRLLLRGMAELYGRERWPLPVLRVRAYQRRRRLKRIVRGLDP